MFVDKEQQSANSYNESLATNVVNEPDNQAWDKSANEGKAQNACNVVKKCFLFIDVKFIDK